MTYQVFNTAGGCEYRGNRLATALREAVAHFADPYVVSAKGKRPVAEDAEGNVIVGEYGEHWDALVNRLREQEEQDEIDQEAHELRNA